MTAPFAFIFTQNMNHEDQLKEMHLKVRQCTLPEKKTMLAMICITMTYEIICSTARAACAVAGVVYIPHTVPQYLLTALQLFGGKKERNVNLCGYTLGVYCLVLRLVLSLVLEASPCSAIFGLDVVGGSNDIVLCPHVETHAGS